jgi:hypothetical protein
MCNIILKLKCFLDQKDYTTYIFENQNQEIIKLNFVKDELNFPLEVDKEYVLSLSPNVETFSSCVNSSC